MRGIFPLCPRAGHASVTMDSDPSYFKQRNQMILIGKPEYAIEFKCESVKIINNASDYHILELWSHIGKTVQYNINFFVI